MQDDERIPTLALDSILSILIVRQRFGESKVADAEQQRRERVEKEVVSMMRVHRPSLSAGNGAGLGRTTKKRNKRTALAEVFPTAAQEQALA